MSHSDDDEDAIDDFDVDSLIEELPALLALKQFADDAEALPWFHAVGTELDAEIMLDAQAFLAALGLTNIGVATLEEIEEASDIAEAVEASDFAGAAEAQLEQALYQAAIERIDEQGVAILLTHIQQRAVEAIRTAALDTLSMWDEADEHIVNLAVGGAIRAIYQKALVIAGHEDEEPHPFDLKFRLFEKGRWPIGVLGSTLSIL